MRPSRIAAAARPTTRNVPTTAPVLLKKLESPLELASLSAAAAPEPAVVRRDPTETVWTEVICVTWNVEVSVTISPAALTVWTSCVVGTTWVGSDRSISELRGPSAQAWRPWW